VFLSKVQNSIIDANESHIILDMSNCNFLHAIFTSYLGSMAYIGRFFGKSITYRTNRGSKLNAYLKDSGLYNHFIANADTGKNPNAIPFSSISLDEDFIIDYIGNILDLAPISLTDQAHEVLFKNIYEIFNNAVDHARSSMGVFACGHWMPTKKHLAFSVYDTGIGIPSLVKEKINTISSSEEALQWALGRGNSTKQLMLGTPRGLGLSDLHSFIKLNDGALNIFSNDIYYQYRRNEIIQSIPSHSIGTLIGITIIADYDHISTVIHYGGTQ
jgi:hypothetical protein